MSYVGEWWTVLILHDCFDGYTRFDQFERNIGLSSSMLTSRLKALVDSGVLAKRVYQERPVRYESVLTDFGSQVLAVDVHGARIPHGRQRRMAVQSARAATVRLGRIRR